MPEYSHQDRQMIEAEQSLWIAREALLMAEASGAFATKIENIVEQIETLAAQMRTYNDQFESNE